MYNVINQGVGGRVNDYASRLVTKMASTQERENKDKLWLLCVRLFSSMVSKGVSYIDLAGQIVRQRSLNAAFIATNGWSTQLRGH